MDFSSVSIVNCPEMQCACFDGRFPILVNGRKVWRQGLWTVSGWREYWAFVEGIGPSLRVLDVGGEYWTLVESTGRWWRVLDVGGKYWTLVESIGRWWRALDVGGKYWTLV